MSSGAPFDVQRLRIGHGYDVHRFAAAPAATGHIMLGGVAVPCERAVLAHSDGDLLVHALCDALLGAAGLGDIGRHFPDTDARWAGASGERLLRDTRAAVAAAGFAPVNADLTLVAQVPRVAPYVAEMRSTLAAWLGLEEACVNVKATTEERLGFTGREEGLAAHAVVLLCRNES